jgi:hypothetical protein
MTAAARSGPGLQEFRIPATLSFGRFWYDSISGDRWVIAGGYLGSGGNNVILVRAIEFWECAP